MEITKANQTVGKYNHEGDLRTDQLAPHSVEAEQAVLGAILISAECFPPVSLILNPDEFFIVRHQWVFEAMTAIYERHDPIDYLTVVDELEATGRLAEIGGAAYILLLINKTPSALNVEGYARIVSRTADKRLLIDGAGKVARAAHADASEVDSERVINEAFEEIRAKRSKVEMFSMFEIAEKSDLREQAIVTLKDGETLAIPTGFDALDKMTDHQIGFEKLVYLLGESRHGKSTWMQQIAMNMVESGSVDWVLYCSIEMTPVNLFDRITCARAGVPLNLYWQNQLDKPNWNKFQKAKTWLRQQTNFHVTGKKVSTSNIARMADVLGNQYGAPGVIFVDTVNKVKGVRGPQGRYEGLTNVSEELDAIKLDGHLVFGALQHKIKREGERKPSDLRPSLESVKESGAPVQDADVFFTIYNADNYRVKFGPTWNDFACPPGHIMSEVLKLRDGSPLSPPIIQEWQAGIPRIAGATIKVVRTTIDAEIDRAYAEREQYEAQQAAMSLRTTDVDHDDILEIGRR